MLISEDDEHFSFVELSFVELSPTGKMNNPKGFLMELIYK